MKDDVIVTRADRQAANPIVIKIMLGELTHGDLYDAFARHAAQARKDALDEALLAAKRVWHDATDQSAIFCALDLIRAIRAISPETPQPGTKGMGQ